jgi:hypothetical protein
MSDRFDPTADEVRTLRESRGYGLAEAQRELRREKIRSEVRSLRFPSTNIEHRFLNLLTIVEALIQDR